MKSSPGGTCLSDFVFSFSISQGGMAWEQLQTQVCLHASDRTLKGKALAKLMYDEQQWPGFMVTKLAKHFLALHCNLLQE